MAIVLPAQLATTFSVDGAFLLSLKLTLIVLLIMLTITAQLARANSTRAKVDASPSTLFARQLTFKEETVFLAILDTSLIQETACS